MSAITRAWRGLLQRWGTVTRWDNCRHRLAELEARQEDHEARTEALRCQLEEHEAEAGRRTADIFAVMDAAATAAGIKCQDSAPALRVINCEEQRNSA